MTSYGSCSQNAPTYETSINVLLTHGSLHKVVGSSQTLPSKCCFTLKVYSLYNIFEMLWGCSIYLQGCSTLENIEGYFECPGGVLRTLWTTHSTFVVFSMFLLFFHFDSVCRVNLIAYHSPHALKFSMYYKCTTRRDGVHIKFMN